MKTYQLYLVLIFHPHWEKEGKHLGIVAIEDGGEEKALDVLRKRGSLKDEEYERVEAKHIGHAQMEEFRHWGHCDFTFDHRTC